MGAFWDGWIASESQDHDALKVKRLYVDMNEGNWYDAALFSQIMYWHGRNKETGERRLKIQRDGHYWLAKRYEDWWAECRVNADTARKAITRMVKRKLLVKNVWLFNGKPTIHIRVNVEAFEVLANHCIAENKELELNRPNVSDANDTIGQMQTLQRIDSYTETTTETTTETKKKDAIASIAQPPQEPKRTSSEQNKVVGTIEPEKEADAKKKTASQSSARRPSPHAPHFEALITAMGIDPETVRGKAGKQYWDAAYSLKQSTVQPDEIRGLYLYVKNMAKRDNWSSWGVNALVKRAPEYLIERRKNQPKPAAPPPAPEPTPEDAPDEDMPMTREEMAAEMDRLEAALVAKLSANDNPRGGRNVAKTA